MATRILQNPICPGDFSRDGDIISGFIGASVSDSAIWHSWKELVSCPEVWLAQCLCESNKSLPYRKLVESAKAEEQRIRIRTSQGASIDGENLNTLGRRQLFRP
jgi:hypothetical protein